MDPAPEDAARVAAPVVPDLLFPAPVLRIDGEQLRDALVFAFTSGSISRSTSPGLDLPGSPRMVSTREQGVARTSLDAQKTEIDRYCAAHGLPDPIDFVEVESGGEEAEEKRSLLAGVRPGDAVIGLHRAIRAGNPKKGRLLHLACGRLRLSPS